MVREGEVVGIANRPSPPYVVALERGGGFGDDLAIESASHMDRVFVTLQERPYTRVLNWDD